MSKNSVEVEGFAALAAFAVATVVTAVFAGIGLYGTVFVFQLLGGSVPVR